MKKYHASLLLGLVLIILLAVFTLTLFTNRSPINTSTAKVTLDREDYYPEDSAIPYYTYKWLENIKFSKKGILTRAIIQTTNEGKISKISFKKSSINVDAKANVNYPFVVRIELLDPKNGKNETLYFSQARYNVARIYRIDQFGNKNKIRWEDIRVGEYAIIHEEVNLLIPNTDSQNNFIDKNVKSLIIYLKSK